MQKRSQHFSLLEIMVVAVIIALFAGIAVTNVVGQGEGAKVNMTKGLLSDVAEAIDLYKVQSGKYPSSDEFPEVLVRTQDGTPGPLKKVPTDAWNNELHYAFPGTRGGAAFDLWSLGADGMDGGTGVDADIYYGESDNS